MDDCKSILAEIYKCEVITEISGSNIVYKNLQDEILFIHINKLT